MSCGRRRFSFLNIARLAGEAAHIGYDMQSVLVAPDAGKIHPRLRHKIFRVFEIGVQTFRRPDQTIGPGADKSFGISVRLN